MFRTDDDVIRYRILERVGEGWGSDRVAPRAAT
jgi:hypothetical protein